MFTLAGTNLIKRTLTSAAGTAAFSRFVYLLERIEGRRPNLLRVLTYHRVDHPDRGPALDSSLISATPENFDRQMAYLAANYHVVSLEEVLDAHRSKNSLPPRSVLITFDDAYRDFAEHAWPVLKRHGLPVTMFVATAFPDQPERTFWWDRLHQALHETRSDGLDTPRGSVSLASADDRARALKQLKQLIKSLPHDRAMQAVDDFCGRLGAGRPEHGVLGWDELRRLSREGVTLGAHTQTHPLMNRVSPEVAQHEAVESLRDLERQIGAVPPIFAYPSGAFSNEVVHRLQREGFALAFTTALGINDLAVADPLRLRRLNVGRRTTDAVFRARLLPWSRHLNRFRPLTGC